MASTTITIAEEFLRSANTQSRKNSLAALAVIDKEGAAELIAQTALSDEDWSVRQRAKTELLYRLVRYAHSIPPGVEDVLISTLQGDDAPKQKRAYAILAELKSKGFYVPSVRMKFGERFWFVATFYFSHYTERNWTFCLRTWRAGLVGTLVGTIPLLIYLGRQRLGVSAFLILTALLIAGFSLLGTIVALFSAQFLTPISMHLRRVSASVVQIVETFLTVFAGTLILYVILKVVVGQFLGYFFGEEYAFTIPVFALLAAFARLGGILTFGRFKFLDTFLNVTSPRNRNLIVQTLGGTLLAFAVTTAVYLPVVLSAPDYGRSEVTFLWLSCLPITVGLAAGFARIDSEAPPIEGTRH